MRQSTDTVTHVTVNANSAIWCFGWTWYIPVTLSAGNARLRFLSQGMNSVTVNTNSTTWCYLPIV